MDDLAMRTCARCGAVLPSAKGRGSHEAILHPDWEPSADLKHERRRYKDRQWKVRQAKAWRFLRSGNESARKYGLPPIPLRTPLPTGPCVYCGAASETWDHVVPLSGGGSHTVANLAPCCHACNRAKGRYPAAGMAAPIRVAVPCLVCGVDVVRTRSELKRTAYSVCSLEHQKSARAYLASVEGSET